MKSQLRKTRQVLLIQSNAIVSMDIQELMRKEGYGVLESLDPDEIKKADYDIVVMGLSDNNALDLEMIDLLLEIHPELPILILSEHENTRIIGKALKKGVFDCLRAPFKGEDLLRRLTIAIKNHQLKQDRALADLENRKLGAQLVHAKRMESFGDMAGNAAFDFYELMDVIKKNTEEALKRNPNSNLERHNLNKVREASIQAHELAKKLMSFFRQRDWLSN